jgi:6-phosphofructokinase
MKIGILSSGGDAPGINATIRGVGKTAINNYGMQVIGIQNGFSGLLYKDIVELTDASLSGILNLGDYFGSFKDKYGVCWMINYYKSE